MNTYREALSGLALDSPGTHVWKALGSAGALARVYFDGEPNRGVDPVALGQLLAAVDERASLGSTLAVCVQVATCLPLLASGGPPATTLLRSALHGDAVVALAATDETAGSDLTALRTTVDIHEDEVVLDGCKRWICNATQCDAALVLARIRPGRQLTNFAWVLVPINTEGVTVSAADTDFFGGSGTGHLQFHQVHLDRDHLVGRPGRAMSSFASHVATERLAGALWGVALCRRVLADTYRRLRARQYAGRTLWDVDVIRQRFAAALIATQQLQSLTETSGKAITSRQDSAAAAMLKASAALTVERVLSDCAHLQGADGFGRTGAQSLRAEAALFGIGGGTTEVMLSSVADVAGRLLEMGDAPPVP